jgi:hypothetical protein
MEIGEIKKIVYEDLEDTTEITLLKKMVEFCLKENCAASVQVKGEKSRYLFSERLQKMNYFKTKKTKQKYILPEPFYVTVKYGEDESFLVIMQKDIDFKLKDKYLKMLNNRETNKKDKKASHYEWCGLTQDERNDRKSLNWKTQPCCFNCTHCLISTENKELRDFPQGRNCSLHPSFNLCHESLCDDFNLDYKI